MTHHALHGRPLARTIDALQALIASGESASDALAELPAGRRAQLWTGAAGTATATPALVALLDRLPAPSEAVPSILSLESATRAAWLPIVLARLSEIGERRDLTALCEVITTAGPLAAELVAGPMPSLAPTAFAELERAVLPAAAHEAPAFPVLLRALAAAASLAPDAAAEPAPLPEIAWDDPSRTWVPGRLIQLPAAASSGPMRSVLTGALDERPGAADPMRWVLERPWAFLLAQIVFTQEAWGAERISGGLALELEAPHVPVFSCPPRIDVVVILPDGQEVRCGSLGEFVARTLGQLQVVLLGHRVTPRALDEALGPAIGALLRHDVWRFEHGAAGRRPAYTIHPGFSDACYRALGSRAFYRLGSGVTAAIRRVAGTWAGDMIARAGAPSPDGVSR